MKSISENVQAAYDKHILVLNKFVKRAPKMDDIIQCYVTINSNGIHSVETEMYHENGSYYMEATLREILHNYEIGMSEVTKSSSLDKTVVHAWLRYYNEDEFKSGIKNLIEIGLRVRHKETVWREHTYGEHASGKRNGRETVPDNDDTLYYWSIPGFVSFDL